jgi:hypothetical protein
MVDYVSTNALSMLGGDDYTTIQNEIDVLDASVVHKTGNLTESINGVKTFTSNFNVNSGATNKLSITSSTTTSTNNFHLINGLGDITLQVNGTDRIFLDATNTQLVGENVLVEGTSPIIGSLLTTPISFTTNSVEKMNINTMDTTLINGELIFTSTTDRINATAFDAVILNGKTNGAILQANAVTKLNCSTTSTTLTNTSHTITSTTGANTISSANTTAVANLLDATGTGGGNTIRVNNGTGGNTIFSIGGTNDIVGARTSGNANTIRATSGGNNSITTTSGSNSITSASGNNTLTATGGNNILEVGSGDGGNVIRAIGTGPGLGGYNSIIALNNYYDATTGSHFIRTGAPPTTRLRVNANQVNTTNELVCGEGYYLGVDGITSRPLISFAMTFYTTTYNTTAFPLTLGFPDLNTGNATPSLRFPYNVRCVGFSVSGDGDAHSALTLFVTISTAPGAGGTRYYRQSGALGASALQGNSANVNILGASNNIGSIVTSNDSTIPTGTLLYFQANTSANMLCEMMFVFYFQQLI